MGLHLGADFYSLSSFPKPLLLWAQPREGWSGLQGSQEEQRYPLYSQKPPEEWPLRGQDPWGNFRTQLFTNWFLVTTTRQKSEQLKLTPSPSCPSNWKPTLVSLPCLCHCFPTGRPCHPAPQPLCLKPHPLRVDFLEKEPGFVGGGGVGNPCLPTS